jgi:hypothetical protein
MKEDQKLIIEHYIDAYNAFDIKRMTQNLNENIVFKNISNGIMDMRTEGIIAFTKQAEAAKQYFKERNQTIDSWNFDEQKVTIGIDYKATLAIDLPNGLKVGDTLELKGKSEFEFEGPKIIKITDNS